MENVLNKLRGGDRRSIGGVSEVAADVLNDPTLFDTVFHGMLGDDPVVRMRAADAVEKITAEHPEYLQPYRQELIGRVARVDQQEVRWHVAQMLPRLEWSAEEHAAVVEILLGYLDDGSKIVKTFTMQALADFAERDVSLQPQVVQWLEELTETGSPAMQSRGRRLLQRLERLSPITNQEGAES
jgi:hypothetical protein